MRASVIFPNVKALLKQVTPSAFSAQIDKTNISTELENLTPRA